MPRLKFLLCILQGILCATIVFGQGLQDGCISGQFGIDADTRSNTAAYGNAAGSGTGSDDWFENSVAGAGVGMIDESNTSQHQTQLSAGSNIIFYEDMAFPQNTVINGTRLIDATYARDYQGGSGYIDNTSYTSASKNGEDPAIWDTGTANVLKKNDIIDAYAHLRREGELISDSLWLDLGFSRVGTTGESYYDAEIFVQEMTYDETTQQMTTAGPDEGHTAWTFNADGSINSVGDLIVAFQYASGATPVLEIRIWVSKADHANLTPSTFLWGSEIDGASNSSQYGYADVLPLGAGSFGCGLGNDGTVLGPPWGTINTAGGYNSSYESYQFAEVGLNLTKVGIDPYLIEGKNPCDAPFSSIVFKSRSSNSFTSQLKDFNGPYPFGGIPGIPTTIVGDSLTCVKDTIALEAENFDINFYYRWETADGNILGNPEAPIIEVDTTGTYILFGAPVAGCNETTDTFTVIRDTIPPTAFANGGIIWECSSPLTLTGGENGHEYNWTGPNGFTSSLQNPGVNEGGIYELTVTRTRNGCTANDTALVKVAPCLSDDSGTTPEDTPIVIDVLANDEDWDGNLDSGSVTLLSGPSNGTTNIDPNTGEVTYTPNSNWHGVDTFYYIACDSTLLCDTAEVIITVIIVNDPPIAVDDYDTTQEDTPVTIDILGNDYDIDGMIDPTTVSVITDPPNGTYTVDPVTGQTTYTPNPNFYGLDSLQYIVCDDGVPAPVLCDTAWVYITVEPVNDPPIAVDDYDTTQEDTPVTIDILDNDYDIDGLIDPTTLLVITDPLNGTYTVDPVTGETTYTPNPNFFGTDSLQYVVCDDGVPAPILCDTAWVYITVEVVNDPPIAEDDYDITQEDTPITIDILDNDYDVDGIIDPTTVSVISDPPNGSFAVDPLSGELHYAPDPNFFGTDSLQYLVCDNGNPDPVLCDTAWVYVNIAPVNDPPEAKDDFATTVGSTPVLVPLPSNDYDIDGQIDPTTVEIISNVPHGTATIDPVTGDIVFIAEQDFVGTVSFDYRICDDGMPVECDTATVTITVLCDTPNGNTCVKIIAIENQ